MTHSTKFIALIILLTVAFFTNINAQDANAIAGIRPSYINNAFSGEENISNKKNVAASPVVLAEFATLFPTATMQNWTASADNCWISFLQNGRKAKASLTQKGKVNYIITDCAMENLPDALSKAITSQYASYRLFNAIEIEAHGTVAYQAILENSKNFITLKCTSEGIDEIQQVKKL